MYPGAFEGRKMYVPTTEPMPKVKSVLALTVFFFVWPPVLLAFQAYHNGKQGAYTYWNRKANSRTPF